MAYTWMRTVLQDLIDNHSMPYSTWYGCMEELRSMLCTWLETHRESW